MLYNMNKFGKILGNIYSIRITNWSCEIRPASNTLSKDNITLKESLKVCQEKFLNTRINIHSV